MCPDPRPGRSIGVLSTGVVINVAITVAIAAAPAPPEPQAPTFRGNIDLVNIGVTVAGKKRQLVTDLRASDFAV